MENGAVWGFCLVPVAGVYWPILLQAPHWSAIALLSLFSALYTLIRTSNGVDGFVRSQPFIPIANSAR